MNKHLCFLLCFLFAFVNACSPRSAVKFQKLGKIEQGKKTITVSFIAPPRLAPDSDDWEYIFSIILKNDQEFKYTGFLKVYSTSGDLIINKPVTLDKVTRASWLPRSEGVSYLVGRFVSLEEMGGYKLVLEFDHESEVESMIGVFYTTK